MRLAHHLPLALVVTCVVLLAAWCAHSPRGMGYSIHRLRVVGRLRDGASGGPLALANVTAYSFRDFAEDEEMVTFFAQLIDGELERVRRQVPDTVLGAVPMPDTNRATTGSDGSFSMLLDVSWCCAVGGWFRTDAEGPPARSGVGALRVVIEGRAPVILDVPEGTWTEHDGEDGLWATWDLGVVEVPGGP